MENVLLLCCCCCCPSKMLFRQIKDDGRFVYFGGSCKHSYRSRHIIVLCVCVCLDWCTICIVHAMVATSKHIVFVVDPHTQRRLFNFDLVRFEWFLVHNANFTQWKYSHLHCLSGHSLHLVQMQVSQHARTHKQNTNNIFIAASFQNYTKNLHMIKCK